jgi:Ni2+-binding GTPase involved in maturation of urease and hydrogenase
VHPSIEIVELSARNGQGMDTWLELLARRIESKSLAAV